MRISPPAELLTDEAFSFCDELLNKTDYAEKYIIDLSNLQFIESGAALIFTNCLIKFISFRSESTVELVMGDSSACRYFARMGLLKRLTEYGNDEVEFHNQGNGNYIPLNFVNRNQITSKPDFISIGDSLDDIAAEMSTNLTRGRDRQLEKILQFCLREIMRNVFEHSGSDELGYCAQYYPNLDKVELSIMDTGIGILQGLSTNPFVKNIQTDRDAVCTALLPGISGKTFKGVIKTQDPWQNSGFGLYMTRKIAEKSGSLMIFSNSAGVRVVKDGLDHFSGWHKGTVVNLIIQPSKIGDVRTLLKDFSREGTKIAKTIEGAEISPSTASQMLSEDIRKLT